MTVDELVREWRAQVERMGNDRRAVSEAIAACADDLEAVLAPTKPEPLVHYCMPGNAVGAPVPCGTPVGTDRRETWQGMWVTCLRCREFAVFGK